MKDTLIKKFSFVAIASVIVNIMLLVIAKALISVPDTFDPFHYGTVIELTLGGILGAAILYALIKTYVKNYDHVFKVISYIALVLSLIPDLTLPYSTDADNIGATWPAVGALICMHIAAGLIAIYGFTRKTKTLSLK